MKFDYFKWILLFFGFVYIAGVSSVNSEQVGDIDSEKIELFGEANTFFNQANKLLDQDVIRAEELYHKAILRYERLVSEGIQNGRLFYNIGNAYFRMGDIGRAILNYRKAERFIPNDPNLQQNLAYVLSQRRDNIEVKQQEKVLKTLFFWHYDFSPKVRALIFAVFYCVFWILLAVRLFWNRPWIHWNMAILLIVCLLFGGSLITDQYLQSQNKTGVLVADKTIARKGDGHSYQPSFEEPLHGGVDFRLLEERGKWLHIELHDGRRTWVPEKSAELVTM